MTEVSHWLAFFVHRLFSFSLCINSLFLKELAYIHTHTYMHIFKILNKRKPHTTMTNSNIIMTLANPFSLFHLSFTMGKKITERGRDLRRRNGQYYVWYCFFFFFFADWEFKIYGSFSWIMTWTLLSVVKNWKIVCDVTKDSFHKPKQQSDILNWLLNPNQLLYPSYRG